MKPLGTSALLILVSIIVFVLVVFNVSIGDVAGVRLVAAGLAFFAAAHLVAP